MNALAFDTCFGACSAAVATSAGRTSASDLQLMARGHAEALPVMLRQTMAQAGLSFGDLERVAVTCGPGTFTGTRVGLAAAFGFATAFDLPVVTYSSLAVIARGAIAALDTRVAAFDGLLVARDAKRDTVFIEIVGLNGGAHVAPATLDIIAARELIVGRRVIVIGTGAHLILDKGCSEAELFDDLVDEMSPAYLEPDARWMLTDAVARGPSLSPAPLYLRAPDAMPSAKAQIARLAPANPT